MSTKSYRPLGNRILVKRDDAVTTTPGGLHLPAVAQAKSDRGVVKYVGPGGVDLSTGRRIEVSVKPGDVVVFPKSAIEIEVGGEKLVMLQEPEVFAVEFESEEAAAAFKGAAVAQVAQTYEQIKSEVRQRCDAQCRIFDSAGKQIGFDANRANKMIEAEMEKLGYPTTTPSGRRRRSDAGVKRGKRGAGVVNVTLNTTAATSEAAEAIVNTTVEKALTNLLDRAAEAV